MKVILQVVVRRLSGKVALVTGGASGLGRAGVKMGFGTDLLGTQHARNGSAFNLRREVITSFEILCSATAVNAEISQMTGKLGVIKPGAPADVLVVDGHWIKRPGNAGLELA